LGINPIGLKTLVFTFKITFHFTLKTVPVSSAQRLRRNGSVKLGQDVLEGFSVKLLSPGCVGQTTSCAGQLGSQYNNRIINTEFLRQTADKNQNNRQVVIDENENEF
jgi:hypothetical protein